METTVNNLSVRRLIRFDGGGTLKAFCDLEVKNLIVIRGIRIIEGKGGLVVTMPRQQGRDAKWYSTVTVMTKAAKAAVNRVVLEAYRQTINDDEEQKTETLPI